MSPVLAAAVAVLTLGGALFVLVSAVGMLRTRDAVQRVNVMSAATGVGMPAILAGTWLHDLGTHGFAWSPLYKTVLAITGMVIISSVASNALGRAAYRSGAPLDPRTRPNELAEDPPG